MKALVFDLDDTLYKELDFVYGAFREVANYLSEKHELDKDEVFKFIIGLLADKGRGRIFNDVCDIYNLNDDINMLIEIYRNAAPTISIYEDAEYILKKYKGKYKLGLITDGKYYVQRNKIRLLGIEKYFDSIIVTDEHGEDFCKPSIKPYVRMAVDLGVTIDEMVYIGDNPQKDFFGAKQLGVYTVRVIRETGEHMGLRLTSDYEADVEIKDMYELERIIDKLFEMR